MTTRPSPQPRLRWADDSPVNSDDARGRITAAAVRCVEQYGPAKTTMDDVARLAAITRPTVYKYFPSRNELLIAAFLRRARPRARTRPGRLLRGRHRRRLARATPSPSRRRTASRSCGAATCCSRSSTTHGFRSKPSSPARPTSYRRHAAGAGDDARASRSIPRSSTLCGRSCPKRPPTGSSGCCTPSWCGRRRTRSWPTSATTWCRRSSGTSSRRTVAHMTRGRRSLAS